MRARVLMIAAIGMVACSGGGSAERRGGAAAIDERPPRRLRAPTPELVATDDASTHLAALTMQSAGPLPGDVRGVLHTSLTPWGEIVDPTDVGWRIEVDPIDERELRRRGQYSLTIDGAHDWRVFAITAIAPPIGGFDVATPSGRLHIDGHALVQYEPAPGGPSRYVHVVDLDVNGGRGAAAPPASYAGIGTQEVAIVDGSDGFPAVADDAVEAARHDYERALGVHAAEIDAAIAKGRAAVEAFDPRVGQRIDEGGEPRDVNEGVILRFTESPAALTVLFHRTIRHGVKVAIFGGIKAEWGVDILYQVRIAADGTRNALWYPPTSIQRVDCGIGSSLGCTATWRPPP